jgi:hypothetical protein
MYDYNFPEQLTQERLTLLLLSIVIPTDTAVLKDIYKKKRELEDDSCRYPRGPWRQRQVTGLARREFSKSLTLIRCLYPNFIMYAKSEDVDPFGGYHQLNDLHSLRKKHSMRDNSISVLNYIVDNWTYICNSDENDMKGWRVKNSIFDYVDYMDNHHTVFDILDGLVNDFKYQIQAIMSMGELVELVYDSGILVDECGFINF